ncbi:MAG: extracellular solute-binding protein, partial [Limnochordia bacterium]
QLLTAPERFEKIVLSTVSDSSPDVVMVGSDAIELGNYGALLPLNSFIEEDGIVLDEIFYPYVSDLVQSKGNIFYLPNMGGGPNSLIYYNRQTFEEAGLDSRRPPQTWSELMDISRRLVEHDGTNLVKIAIDVVGSNQVDVRGSNIQEWFLSNGVYLWDGEGNVLFNTSDGVETVQWVLDFTNSINQGEEALRGFYIRTASDSQAAFLAQNSAMLLSGSHVYSYAEQRGLDVGVGLRPHNDKDFLGSASAGWGYGIPSGTKHPEAAWELLKWLTMSEEGAGWFALQQGRPSAVVEFNTNEAYYDANPYWSVFIEGFMKSAPLYAAPADHLKVLATMITDVVQMRSNPKDAIAEGSRQLQRLFDEWKQ